MSKALIVAPAWVGDMVMAHCLIQLLASQYSELHVLAPAATAPLAQRMAEVTGVHLAEFAHGELGLTKRRDLGRQLRAEGYTAAVVLPNSWKSALVPWFAQIPRRVGWHGEARYGLLNDRRALDKEAYPLMIERFMALASATGTLPAQPYPLPQLVADAENAARLCATHQLRAERVTVLCPGAEFGAAKKWPARHYAGVAQAVMARGGEVWLLGSPKDAADAQAICELAPGAHNLAGKTSLLDALDLLSLADQVVCNDSGLMHVACALNRPTVGVFGSTSPGFTPPLGEHAAVVELTLACRPCFQRECPLGHLDCLETLAPERVIARLSV